MSPNLWDGSSRGRVLSLPSTPRTEAARRPRRMAKRVCVGFFAGGDAALERQRHVVCLHGAGLASTQVGG